MKRIDLNDGWQFVEECNENFLKEKEYQGQTETVRIPHTCRTTPFNYFDESIYQMICGYRKAVDAPKEWEGKRILLTIGAAGHSAEVYVNGRFVMSHHCGYTAFTAELTGYLNYGGENIIAIKVNSREDQDFPPFGYVIDYMTYGGLYREVFLEIKEPVYIEDVFAKAELVNSGASGRVESEITINDRPGAAETGAAEAQLYLRQRLYEHQGTDEFGNSIYAEEIIAERIRAVIDCDIITKEWHGISRDVMQMDMDVPEIKLWSTESPALYVIRTELIRRSEIQKESANDGLNVDEFSGITFGGPEKYDETVLDVYEDVIGFRTAVFMRDGFYLNGKKTMLIGLNRHQCWPYTGYAMPASLQRHDAEIARNELGLNIVRTSHYPQSPHFLRRCDELGLMVFTEIPGWQHIGGDDWKDQAVRNVEDMIIQNRNHPSIILWGTRINESVDDDDFYIRTAKAAKGLDKTRQISGVRCYKKSHLIEDVYAYNDFSHTGDNPGCEKKAAVTSDIASPYFISECNGHMFPTKIYDCEDHRTAHALRHASCMNSAFGEPDITGIFQWCMFDYNTHKDFGSGDRICYHGVMDMYRNPKLAAAVYMSQQTKYPYLEVSSLMAMGEHPAGYPGKIYIFSNADEVRFYRNDRLVKVFYPSDNSSWPNLKHPPMLIDEYISDEMQENEGYSDEQAAAIREILNYSAICGSNDMSARMKAKTTKLMLKYHMTSEEAYRLYGKYIGSWGREAVVYRFDAVSDGEVVRSLVRSATTSIHISAAVDHTELKEGSTYDAAAVRLSIRDQNGALMSYYNGTVKGSITGPAEFIGPDEAQIRGGCGGLYIRTTGKPGDVCLCLKNEQMEEIKIGFTVTVN